MFFYQSQNLLLSSSLTSVMFHLVLIMTKVLSEIGFWKHQQLVCLQQVCGLAQTPQTCCEHAGCWSFQKPILDNILVKMSTRWNMTEGREEPSRTILSRCEVRTSDLTHKLTSPHDFVNLQAPQHAPCQCHCNLPIIACAITAGLQRNMQSSLVQSPSWVGPQPRLSNPSMYVLLLAVSACCWCCIISAQKQFYSCWLPS